MAAQLQRFQRFGGGIHDGSLAVREQLGQFLAQFLAQLVVEVDQRLIQQQQLGFLDQRARQRRTLLLAAGQFGRGTLQIRSDVQAVGHAHHAGADLCLRYALDAQRRGDVLIDGKGWIIDKLLVHHRQIAMPHRDAGHVAAIGDDAPGARFVQARHHAHQRRLAGLGGTEQDVDRAWNEGQRERIQVIFGAILLADIL